MRKVVAFRMGLGALVAIGILVIVAALAITETGGNSDSTPAGPVLKPLPEPVAVSVLQDSFSSGSNMGGNSDFNWTKQIAFRLSDAGFPIRLEVSETPIDSPSTLPSTRPTVNESTVTSDDKLVVVFLGDADAYANRRPEYFLKELRDITAAAPTAEIVLVGPAFSEIRTAKQQEQVTLNMRSAAGADGIEFIDPIAEGWFSGPNRILIGPDNLHPTDSGHKLIAEKLYSRLKTALLAEQ